MKAIKKTLALLLALVFVFALCACGSSKAEEAYTPVDTDTVAVGAVPEGYSCEQGKVEQMVSDLVLILSDNAAALPEMMQSSMAAKFATLGSINSESVTSPSEARRLLDTLFSCDNAEFSPSGKKTMLNFSVEELQNLFIE